MTSHLLKCSLILSSLTFSGRLPTHRCRVSRTIMEANHVSRRRNGPRQSDTGGRQRLMTSAKREKRDPSPIRTPTTPFLHTHTLYTHFTIQSNVGLCGSVENIDFGSLGRRRLSRFLSTTISLSFFLSAYFLFLSKRLKTWNRSSLRLFPPRRLQLDWRTRATRECGRLM